MAESFVEAMYHQDTEILQLLSEGLIQEKRDFFYEGDGKDDDHLHEKT
jgi:hypothetical protein